MVLLRKKLKKLKYNIIINSLKRASYDDIIKKSEKKAISAYNRASTSIPFYKNFLKSIKKDNLQVCDIKSFKSLVPVVDKQSVYTPDNINKILPYKSSTTTQSILLSSGSSGTFSFGLNMQNELKRSSQFMDILLDYYFNIIENRTLILNCLPQAIKVSTKGVTVAEIGPRADSLIYLLSTLSHMFYQTIIIGDNHFIKNSIEDGIREGIKFNKLRIHLILGGIYLPENLRTYLANILCIDLNNPQTGSIYSSMGLSELGLNVFFESRETMALRRLMNKDPMIREKILPESLYTFLPMFFNYFPQTHYLEEINNDIVITNLSRSSVLPLIRYNSKDKGKLFPYKKLKELQIKQEYLPPFNSPLVLIYGRGEFIEFHNKKIYPHLIQEGLYSDNEISSSTTGNFRLIKKKDEGLALHIQLKEGITLRNGLQNKFYTAITNYTDMDIPIALHLYHSFPSGVCLDYERKFKHI